MWRKRIESFYNWFREVILKKSPLPRKEPITVKVQSVGIGGRIRLQ